MICPLCRKDKLEAAKIVFAMDTCEGVYLFENVHASVCKHCSIQILEEKDRNAMHTLVSEVAKARDKMEGSYVSHHIDFPMNLVTYVDLEKMNELRKDINKTGKPSE